MAVSHRAHRVGLANIRDAFTLIELLVVIGLIILIAAFAVPALTTLSSSNNLSTAGRIVSNVLTAARSEAISRRALVRFEVATTWPPDQSQAFRKFTTVQHDLVSGADVQLSKWETLPAGVAFHDPSTPSSGSYFFALNQTQMPALKVGNNQIATKYVEFLPTGALNVNLSSAPIRLRLVQGVVSNTASVTQTNANNWFEVVIDGLLGRVSVLRP